MSVRCSREDSEPVCGLPSRLRGRWERTIVRFHIEDLNGLYDALALRACDADVELSPGAWQRIHACRTAAAWSPAAFAREAWAYIEDGLQRPEDAFGAILLLEAAGSGVDVIRPRLPASSVPVFVLAARVLADASSR